MAEPRDPPQPDAIVDGAYQILARLIGIVRMLVVGILLIFFGLVVTYVFVLLGGEQAGIRLDQAQPIRELILQLWEQIAPLGIRALAIIAPVLLLLELLIVVRWLFTTGRLALDRSQFELNLNSVLAITIVVTICLLPLIGLEVPQVLGNVALVVVGFYFGRKSDEAPQSTPEPPRVGKTD
jgi:hypothetical protein